MLIAACVQNVLFIILNGFSGTTVKGKEYLSLSLVAGKKAHKRLCSRWRRDKSFSEREPMHWFSSNRFCCSLNVWEVLWQEQYKPEDEASRRHAFDAICSIKQLFRRLYLTSRQCPPHDSGIVTGTRPVTVNGAVDTDLVLSGQGIEEGTGFLLSCLSLPRGLIHQMEKPMADWQHPSTLPPARLFLT